MEKFSQKNFKKAIDRMLNCDILKVQKENNLQKVLASNTNTGVSYYEREVAPKGGQGLFKNLSNNLTYYERAAYGDRPKP